MIEDLRYRFEQDGKSWELDLHTITVDEQIKLRKVTGLKWFPLLLELDEREPLGCKALAWLARTRAGETVQFDTWNYPVTSMRVTKLEPVLDDEPVEGDEAEEPDASDPPSATPMPAKT